MNDSGAKEKHRKFMERMCIDIQHRPRTGIVYQELDTMLESMMDK